MGWEFCSRSSKLHIWRTGTNDHQLVENSKANEILSQSMTLENILEENLKDIITISLGDQLYIQLGTILTCNT